MNADRRNESKTNPTAPRTSVKKQAARLTGMQRWFRNLIGDAIPFTAFAYAAHVTAAIWTILALAAVIFTIGWLFKIPLFLFVIASAVLYVALVRKGHQMANDPTAQLEWYQEPFWNGLLIWMRRSNWSGHDPSRSKRPVIDRREKPVGDDQLSKLQDLDDCEVLDLENCSVTDKSLRAIVKLKQLQCLVVRETDMTVEGIQKLQQKRPDLWIWY